MPKHRMPKSLFTIHRKQLFLLMRNFCIPLCPVSLNNEISYLTKSYIVFYVLGSPNYTSFSLC